MPIPQKGRKARWQLVSFASASLTGTYQAVSAATTNPAQILSVTNDNTTAVTFSFDGVNDAGRVRAASDKEYNLGAASQSSPNMECMELPANTLIYVKGTAGTGTIYFEIISQSAV